MEARKEGNHVHRRAEEGEGVKGVVLGHEAVVEEELVGGEGAVGEGEGGAGSEGGGGEEGDDGCLVAQLLS